MLEVQRLWNQSVTNLDRENYVEFKVNCWPSKLYPSIL